MKNEWESSCSRDGFFHGFRSRYWLDGDIFANTRNKYINNLCDDLEYRLDDNLCNSLDSELHSKLWGDLWLNVEDSIRANFGSSLRQADERIKW